MEYKEDEIRFYVERCLETFRNTDTLVSMDFIDEELRNIMSINLMDEHWLKLLADVLAQMETDGEIYSCEVLTCEGYSKVFWLE